MRIVIALGGNALLRREEPLTADNQRQNVKAAAEALAPIAREHELVITHGNGPQVGLLALQGAAYRSDEVFPLDILDAETEGMIGYLIEQELSNLLPDEHRFATLLTQIEVESKDPAFNSPTKPIGPVYRKDEAQRLMQQLGWNIAPDGNYFRRVVSSPRPKSILELRVIELLVNQKIIVICAGGGGIPVVRRADGSLVGIEAVIDKDMASSLLARELKADVFLLLTDVDAVYKHWGEPEAQPLPHLSPMAMREYDFAPGSMAPKVKAACEYVEQTGGIAGIGSLKDASAILNGKAGTRITRDKDNG
ncbi:MAG: carbamate kinase [endosymbiont of Escarpia spicata]|uniref:Carbamate kinase n=1 Tax=endosymbiont of Escarpia spicata TaxID=2200908 RepID=A0A370DSI4_9GAMM|nr:MAG: carbamate kinase [endosymbiont of Escarpia spicata]